ncbi:MAG: single-stranded-DNA-specific exonuclease RecJ [Crocinitomicaceae bacterium]|nr:single-stranded-DNA-specific exonuclease RecJ [Crocinitomicaceae bacterium]
MDSNKNQWLLKKVDETISKKLALELKISIELSKILVSRGITNFDLAENYFRPKKQHFYNAFLMKGMEISVHRLKSAIEQNQNILIYGDYDVDGTCSVALMVRFLKKINASVKYYQPHRETEGYGLSLKSVEWSVKNKINLVIALDCGIKDLLAADALKKNNIDLIICDHHKPGEELPKAFAILNPKQEDCHYPFKELCGCGIGLKLVQAYDQKFDLQLNLSSSYQLAAVATAADVVPLKEENRLITFLGLKEINMSPINPFKILFSTLKKEGGINIGDLIFKVAPRINAAGRLDTAILAADFLISDSKEAIKSLKEIEINNEDRKSLDEQTTLEAMEYLNIQPKERYTNFVYSKKWHKGVVGIVASRIIEKYYKPTIVLTGHGDVITGSARSVKDFDIYSVLHSLKHYFIRFGGHKYAAGLSLKKENLELFKKAFEDEVKKHIKKENLFPKILIDHELSLKTLFSDANGQNIPKIFRIIQQMEPFGVGNPKPIFIFKNLINDSNPKIVGENHIKFQFLDVQKENTINGIWFNSISSYDLINNKNQMDVVGSMDENIFRNQRSLQILIKDIRIV